MSAIAPLSPHRRSLENSAQIPLVKVEVPRIAKKLFQPHSSSARQPRIQFEQGDLRFRSLNQLNQRFSTGLVLPGWPFHFVRIQP
jgi:hypothetical protein